MNLQAFFFISLSVASLAANGQQPPSPIECPEYDRITYAAPRRDWPGSIVIERALDQARASSATHGAVHRSPHGTASYILLEPDTTKPGPWETIVDILGNRSRGIHLRIRITDHISGGVRVRWLNEKLLWLQVWRGRIVSTDAILDVETQRLLYEEDAHYNSLIVPCSAKSDVPK